MKLAIFGGTFDPVHCGHLELAKRVVQRLSFDSVLFVPAKCSPFKRSQKATPALHRQKMLQLALADNPHFRLELCELERQGEQSYTLDTIVYLEQKYPYCRRLSLIIGFDQAILFANWHQWEELLRRVDVVVARRLGVTGELPEMLARATKLEFDSPCSSTLLRKSLGRGGDGGDCLLPAVRRYIDQEGLYRNR